MRLFNMKNIKVSVIIPVYNTAGYVAESINSITNQTLRDIEIIVIDDGSTDESLQIIEKIGSTDERIRIVSRENKGISVTRNEGISLAQGEYIYLMDSDDLLLPDTLNACYTKCKSEKLDLVFFDAKVFGDVDNTPLPSYDRTSMVNNVVLSGTEMLRQLFSIDSFLVSSCLNFIDLSYLKKNNLTFYPNIIHEDELFTFLLYLHAEKVGYMGMAYFKRRVRSDSVMTTQFSKKNIVGYFTVASELIKLKDKTDSREIRALIDKRLSDMMPAVLYVSRRLQLSDRYYVVSKCLNQYKKYISWKQALLTLFSVAWIKKTFHF